MGGRALPISGGKVFPAKNYKLNITHKTNDIRTNHGRRRRPCREAFRRICSHDITPIDVSQRLLSGYTILEFFLRLVLGG